MINRLLICFLHPLSIDEEETADYHNKFADGSLISRPLPDFWNNLTNSEKKVFQLICQGYTDNNGISDNLNISRHTVKFHVRNILRKSGTSNRKELLIRIST